MLRGFPACVVLQPAFPTSPGPCQRSHFACLEGVRFVRHSTKDAKRDDNPSPLQNFLGHMPATVTPQEIPLHTRGAPNLTLLPQSLRAAQALYPIKHRSNTQVVRSRQKGMHELAASCVGGQSLNGVDRPGDRDLPPRHASLPSVALSVHLTHAELERLFPALALVENLSVRERSGVQYPHVFALLSLRTATDDAATGATSNGTKGKERREKRKEGKRQASTWKEHWKTFLQSFQS